MTDKADPHEPVRVTAGVSRRAKLIFLAVVAVPALVIYVLLQRDPQILAGWSEDLDAVCRRAAAESRKVVVIFHASPPGSTTRQLATTTLAKGHNIKAIEEGRFLRARVRLDTALQSATARKYKISRLPTVLLLGPDGAELNRREGMIGEVPFRQDFLTCNEVLRPEETPAP
jgi:hypothetical protein